VSLFEFQFLIAVLMKDNLEFCKPRLGKWDGCHISYSASAVLLLCPQLIMIYYQFRL
jgi:hypothetical protein